MATQEVHPTDQVQSDCEEVLGPTPVDLSWSGSFRDRYNNVPRGIRKIHCQPGDDSPSDDGHVQQYYLVQAELECLGGGHCQSMGSRGNECVCESLLLLLLSRE